LHEELPTGCDIPTAEAWKKQALCKMDPLQGAFCTRGRGRTGTALLPLVFETSASTNSATRAVYRGLRECEDSNILLNTQKNLKAMSANIPYKGLLFMKARKLLIVIR
jgi:hypothetical protein